MNAISSSNFILNAITNPQIPAFSGQQNQSREAQPGLGLLADFMNAFEQLGSSWSGFAGKPPAPGVPELTPQEKLQVYIEDTVADAQTRAQALLENLPDSVKETQAAVEAAAEAAAQKVKDGEVGSGPKDGR